MPNQQAPAAATRRPPARGTALDRAKAIRTAEVLAALADADRLRLFSLLATAGAGQVRVCRLVEALGPHDPGQLDTHLEHLRKAGLLTRHEHHGRMYCRLTEDGRARARALFGPAPAPCRA
ncbi:hypothetical protein AB0B50_19460 [Streptomyces sp. NPDC041068]|uniref:ArsR/SmtB family transcription factor n=1 Tax=Streptomyces sp. NPDC041068 TaxID=3155130 RepID=UPI0033F539A6